MRRYGGKEVGRQGGKCEGDKQTERHIYRHTLRQGQNESEQH